VHRCVISSWRKGGSSWQKCLPRDAASGYAVSRRRQRDHQEKLTNISEQIATRRSERHPMAVALS
jgi:hypothetical protein